MFWFKNKKIIFWYAVLTKGPSPKKGTVANTEDPDEMMHTAALHQGLYCFLRQN